MRGIRALTAFAASHLRYTPLALLLMFSVSPAHAQCELGLVLAMDVTQSVDDREWDLQRSGLAAAIEAQQRWRPTLVAIVQWAADVQTVIGPVPVASAGEAAVLAHLVAGMPRLLKGHTKLANSMEAIVDLADEMPCARKIIDVSGDGMDYPPPGQPVRARERAWALGITINGLEPRRPQHRLLP